MTALPYSTAGFERDEYVVDGIRSVVYSAGKGPPVVYLHGGGTYHGFEWARDWLDDFRVIVPHHPGFGESADHPSLSSIEDYAAHYARLFETLDLGRFHLAGASMGGWLAAEIALSTPDLIDRLVLVSPAGLSSPAHPRLDFASVPPADLPTYLVTDPAFIAPFWPARPDARLAALLMREAGATGRVMQTAEAAEKRLRRALPRLRVPALILWGERDRVLPAGLAGEWKALLRDARVEVIPNGGHLLLDEFPAARRAGARFLSGK
jgi:pimeloyl-ACP methyl ester carboxylesterase